MSRVLTENNGCRPVCPVSELPTGARRIVQIGALSVGVYNIDGRYTAINNRCPHKGGPLCLGIQKGLVTGPEPHVYEITRHGEILQCPWHGWEFDLFSGRSVFDPERVRVKSYPVTVQRELRVETYPVTVDEGWIVVHVAGTRPSHTEESNDRQ